MAYIGTKPTIGNFQICDPISVVNGQAAYTMQVGSVNVIPQSANHMIVSLNGTIQKPNSSFTVSGSTITFASNLATGDVIDFIQILGDVLDLGVPSDNVISTAKIVDDAVTLAKMAPGTDGNIISYDASGNPVAVATGNDGQVLTSAGAGSPPAFESISSPKIIGHHYENFSIDETTTSATYADVPSNKGRASYTTVGANSNFIVQYGCNYKQTGNHASYLYFFSLRYRIKLQSDDSVIATGNNRLTMQNINEGTLITNNDSTTQAELLDPGTVAAGTALYFQPQFSSQSTGTLKLIQLNIFEVSA